ncbi:MAG: nicotinate (nicotinamide) nucleotide adenylyltransferase [Alphaproteobacteria bacterium]|nr:nicotinate (nicotinamide) nucleotide adenylyltransferase [Alphaproteobacteria bacterium]
MKIGILGGSFNPPHQGHLHISELARKQLGLDQIWWVVAEKNPLKDPKDYQPYAGRIRQCRVLVGCHPRIKILPLKEIYTEKLLTRLKQKHPRHHFFFIAGADVLADLHRWKNFKKILAKVDLVIFARGQKLLQAQQLPAWKFIKVKNRYQLFFTKTDPTSSTKLRTTSCFDKLSMTEPVTLSLSNGDKTSSK